MAFEPAAGGAASTREELVAELQRKNEFLTRLNAYSLELTSVKRSDNLLAHAVRRLKELSGAVVASIALYDARTSELVVRHTTLSDSERSGIARLLGRGLEGMRMHVSPEMRRRILTEVIGNAGTLHEATFGAIPAFVGAAIERLLGVGWLTGVGLEHAGELLGTVVVAGPRGARPPGGEELRAFAGVTANAVRRWLAEQEVLATEARYRHITESLRDVVFRTTPELVFCYVSPSVANLIGFAPAEVLGRSLYQFVAPSSQASLRRAVETSSSDTGGGTLHAGRYEMELVHRDGRRIWAEIVVDPIYDAYLSHPELQGTMRDATARIRAEESLRRSEERLRTVVSQVPLVLFATDGEGVFTLCEGAGLAALHLAPGELVGRRLEAVYAAAPQVLAGARAALGGEQAHVETALGDGHFEIWFEPARTADGAVTGLIAVASDVTARRRAEAERERLEAELQHAQRMESVGRLAGGVAHDFNNLLTAITGNVAELSELRAGDPRFVEPLGEISRAVTSAATLTHQLLAFSRKQILAPRVLDVGALMAALERMLVRLIGEHIELGTSVAPDLWRVRADPGLVEQMLVNLVVNARDAMPRGGKITLHATHVALGDEHAARHPGTQAGEHVRLSVSDEGHGMSEAVKRHLFEPFFTTKPQGQGTGLGLAMVYGAMRQCHGSVEVESELGRGTTVHLYFPRSFGAVDVASPQPGTGVEPPHGHETVLLVEDEPLVRRVTARVLRRLGYDVLVASGGEEALAVAQARVEPIDLLFTDVVMPGLNGRELAERMVRLHPNTKVLFSSGYTDDEIVAHGVLEERVSFLGKPYTNEALAHKLREVLGPHAADDKHHV